jgi:hypothetical protein
VSSFSTAGWGQDYITVKWKAITNADGYNIYWENKNDPTDSGVVNVDAGSGTMSEKITGLSSNTYYKIYVRAYVKDAYGNQIEGAKTSTLSRKTSK